MSDPKLTITRIRNAAEAMKACGFDGDPLELGFHIALSYLTGKLTEEFAAVDDELSTKEKGVTVDVIIKMTKHQVLQHVLELVLGAGQELSGEKFNALADRLAAEAKEVM